VEVDNQNIADFETMPAAPHQEKRISSLAFILTLVALLVWFGFQTLQLLRERTSLSLAKESQDSAIQESQKVQAQFQTIMSKTAELAAKGHPGAKMVIEELQKRGVGLAPETKPSDQPPPPKPAAKPDIKSLK
jgi:hypothetical protein